MTGPERSSVETGDAGDRATDVNSGWRGGGGGRRGERETSRTDGGWMEGEMVCRLERVIYYWE